LVSTARLSHVRRSRPANVLGLTTDSNRFESRQAADRVSSLTAKASSIAAVVRRHQQLARDAQAADQTICGDYDPLELASIWEQLKFSAEEVDQWLEARCYSPLVARDLRTRGVTPAQAGAVTAAGVGEPDTIAFKLSTSRLLLREALKELEPRERVAAHELETSIRRRVAELVEAFDALLAQLRDQPADPATVACVAADLLQTAKQNAIALSYLHRRSQEVGDELPAGLIEELHDTAAELNALHDNHAPRILGLVDTADLPTTRH
jgi:AraC-like DNA-binding protein